MTQGRVRASNFDGFHHQWQPDQYRRQQPDREPRRPCTASSSNRRRTGATTTIDIANNTLIQSAENQGIVFARGATDVTVIIRGNGTDASNGIRGPADAISVNNAVLTNVTFIVGGDTAADGNFIVSPESGIGHRGRRAAGASWSPTTTCCKVRVAVEFEGVVTGGAEVIVVNNGDINITGAHGIQFQSGVAGTFSNVTMAGNSASPIRPAATGLRVPGRAVRSSMLAPSQSAVPM